MQSDRIAPAIERRDQCCQFRTFAREIPMPASFASVMILGQVFGCQPQVVFKGTGEASGGYRSSTASPVEGSVRQLNSAEIERLRVVWNKPEIVSARRGDNRINLTGRLQLLLEDGKQTRPVDWPQPIAVAIAKNAGAPPSFDKGFPDEVFAVEFCTVNAKDQSFPAEITRKDGSFSALFALSEIHREIDVEREFAVALSLGQVVGQTAKWNSRDAVLKTSIGAARIPGQPKLNKVLKLINSCPDRYGGDYDPKIIIRTVNELRGLGRDGALMALDDYCNLASPIEHSSSRGRVPDEIDTADPSCLEYLVELLFGNLRERIDRQPEVELRRDIPFHREHHEFIMRSGPPRDFSDWVDRARTKGRFSSQKLRPADDPLSASDEYFADLVPRLNAEEPEHLRNGNSRKDRPAIQKHIRRQAIRLIKSDEILRALPSLNEKAANSDTRWQELKLEVAKLKIQWDERLQEYRVGTKQ